MIVGDTLEKGSGQGRNAAKHLWLFIDYCRLIITMLIVAIEYYGVAACCLDLASKGSC